MLKVSKEYAEMEEMERGKEKGRKRGRKKEGKRERKGEGGKERKSERENSGRMREGKGRSERE